MKKKNVQQIKSEEKDMATPEDALKAVEALTEITRDMSMQYGTNFGWIEKLNALRMGCEAIRMGRRESGFAQNIIQRPLPPEPQPTGMSA